jgi:hypothetical protein
MAKRERTAPQESVKPGTARRSRKADGMTYQYRDSGSGQFVRKADNPPAHRDPLPDPKPKRVREGRKR